jgi:hypothetical protein
MVVWAAEISIGLRKRRLGCSCSWERRSEAKPPKRKDASRRTRGARLPKKSTNARKFIASRYLCSFVFGWRLGQLDGSTHTHTDSVGRLGLQRLAKAPEGTGRHRGGGQEEEEALGPTISVLWIASGAVGVSRESWCCGPLVLLESALHFFRGPSYAGLFEPCSL